MNIKIWRTLRFTAVYLTILGVGIVLGNMIKEIGKNVPIVVTKPLVIKDTLVHKRFFLLSYRANKGRGDMTFISYGGFFSRQNIIDILDSSGIKEVTIGNIYEFPTEQDYNNFGTKDINNVKTK